MRHAVATSSGTTALHLALIANGIGPGDEVITSPFTFVASANAMLYVGAKPVFVDVDPIRVNRPGVSATRRPSAFICRRTWEPTVIPGR